MSERVLPLRGISVFEAAARAASFQAAADELNLTPSAVSHQIRLLEASLGVRLFERVGRGVTLTPEGAEYARSVRQSIRRLRAATSDIKTRGKNGGVLDVVRIEAPPSFARCWLLPRLTDLMARLPGTDIRVDAQGSYLQGDRLPWPAPTDAPVDMQIVYGDDDLWADRALHLFSESFQPLCSPGLIEGRNLNSPRDLLQEILVRTLQNAISWEEWLDLQGIDLHAASVDTIQLDPSHLAIEAAAKGLGFILESSILVQHEMSVGKLVSPFPSLSRPGLSYWILTAPAKRARPAIDAVVAWFKEKAATASSG
ncbi:LysR family transcriptional regulator [Rhizobium ruizarguesonis]|jgi:LysR family glycine cleavage system transcriptional activator|uniref:LysR family transcriptional regulator n=1 Tax=Rhizobium TaxID=379 RepID=UPI001031ECB5|nr:MULTISPECIES: LysR family transcriptional regulator [Rhizobium]NEH75674.1 LysR family transcriptional regulator [Rhizobium ruizarguesonis]NEJ16692.1 LysR family transcriptional regulator [Rhizobium ruizarguesonis]NEJ85500.1 LysR family transcriptional regulator [Rhizobium ruizarguesonis]NEJ96952.1 LysR family transcriptional regulator [Rhizobium ruizarguesonis]NEK30488.1 LysR family transcriptional regulator [Rhizobium ruizarguesonis]